MAVLIDGKTVSAKRKELLKQNIIELKGRHNIVPSLAVIVVGDDPASAVYVRNKHKSALETGIISYDIKLPATVTEIELLLKIKELNEDPKINGILVQLPLPPHISEEKIISSIAPEKDVDAFHPVNVGKIMIGNYYMLPCTPAGIMKLLEYYKIDVSEKKCVVIGRSNIVGKPMSMLLLQKHGTVTICHSKTESIKDFTKDADIIIVAVGKARFLTADMVRPGAVVIDVGINRGEDGKISGDVDFESVSEIASYITPVPGGVGPMTITMLLENTFAAAKKQHFIQ